MTQGPRVKIFVGQIDSGTSETELYNLFGSTVAIESITIKQSDTKQSDYAFLVVNSEADAKHCIDEFHNQQFKTKTLVEDYASNQRIFDNWNTIIKTRQKSSREHRTLQS